MSRKSDTDSVARLFPFLSGSGVDRPDASTAPGAPGRPLIRDDERTLFDAEGVLLSEVSGGVTSCRTADLERADDDSRNARDVVDTPVDTSLAF